jgi:hypothetical protein
MVFIVRKCQGKYRGKTCGEEVAVAINENKAIHGTKQWTCPLCQYENVLLVATAQP